MVRSVSEILTSVRSLLGGTAALIAGQTLVNLSDPEAPELFMLAAALIVMSLT